ncbi:MAG TPA: TIR domain-containing protein [Caulobacteraceae bacterium]|nr:TIR domain-containing protein [Caulobacteraceae bacterium]
MADVFVSYARVDKARVAPLVAAIKDLGWSVWWDPAIAPGQEFDRLIAAELEAASAVLVVWTPASVDSRWVRGEAREAADRGVLVPVRFEAARLPIDARAIHTTDLDAWDEKPESPAFQELTRALGAKISARVASRAADHERPAPGRKGVSVCVLPFANISGEAEQEYFSDGISEDIITDLSKVSALSVVSRNTAFTFKGGHVDVRQVARQLGVTHVLEGSVRKAGGRVRITAQLIDGMSDSHVWAERYDRDLNDIFAVQDEISRAIVGALRVKLLPEEAVAIGQRSTVDPEAYKLYLLARHYSVLGAVRHQALIVRLCRRALEIDPNYARAWALLAIGQSLINILGGQVGDNGWDAAERAIALDPSLADAYAARGRILTGLGRFDEALVSLDTALRLDPDSYEANAAAGRCYLAVRRFDEAVACLEKAAEVFEADFWALGMAVQAYQQKGDIEGARSAARRTVERVEKVLAVEPDNGTALSFGVNALASLGEVERAEEWTERGLLVDPDNRNMAYNLGCAMALLGRHDRALELLDRVFKTTTADGLRWIKTDADLDSLQGDARFQALVAEAESRIAAEAAAVTAAAAIG